MELVQIQPSLPVPSSTSQQTQKAVKTVEQGSARCGRLDAFYRWARPVVRLSRRHS